MCCGAILKICAAIILPRSIFYKRGIASERLALALTDLVSFRVAEFESTN